MEAFECDGYWWLPQFPDRQVMGKLSFHPVNGTSLKIVGDDLLEEISKVQGLPVNEIAGARFYPSLDGQEIDIILGVGEQGESITLFNCFVRTFTVGSGLSSVEFRVQAIFSGCHFHKPEDIVFEELRIEYPYLAQWLGYTGFSTDMNHEPHFAYQMNYAYPEYPKLRINDLSLSFHIGFTANNGIEEFRAKQTTSIKIVPAQAMHYSEYQRNMIYHLRIF